MKHYGDICEIRGDKVPLVDIVTGGSPCQDLSVAGRIPLWASEIEEFPIAVTKKRFGEDLQEGE